MSEVVKPKPSQYGHFAPPSSMVSLYATNCTSDNHFRQKYYTDVDVSYFGPRSIMRPGIFILHIVKTGEEAVPYSGGSSSSQGCICAGCFTM